VTTQEERTGDGEVAEKSTGSFGGLSPAEAGRRSAEKRKERLAAAAVTIEDATDAHLAQLAKGTGMVALKAIEMQERRAREARVSHDKPLLALLTASQRACIEAWLRGEAVSQAGPCVACGRESPANEDIRAGI
jgi:hypothetical protein